MSERIGRELAEHGLAEHGLCGSAAVVSQPTAGLLIRRDADLASWGAGLVAPPERRVFPGIPEQIAPARRFVADALNGGPADAAVLLASEKGRRHPGTDRRVCLR